MDDNSCIDLEQANWGRVKSQLHSFLERNISSTCVIFDFDECLVKAHLSRLVTQSYLNRPIVNQPNFSDHSFIGIYQVLMMYNDIHCEDLGKTCKLISSQAPFRPYALDLLKKLNQNGFSTVIISSGLDLAITEKISRYDLKIQLFACQLQFDSSGKCVQPRMVITEPIKGDITAEIVRSGNFHRVFAVGHSKGDISMLRNAIGIAFRGDEFVEKSATYVVDSFNDVKKIVLE